MTRAVVVLGFSLSLCTPAAARAQTPDFSGTWVLDPTRTTITGAPNRADSPVRIGGNIRPPVKIKDVRPVYPQAAQRDRLAGRVIMEAVIGPDGSVTSARVLQSIPALDQAALDAVMQWKFTPTTINGVPVPVLMTVTTSFALAGVPPTPASVVGQPGPKPFALQAPPPAGPMPSAPASSSPAPRMTIEQTADALTISRDTPAGPTTRIYRLDGSDSRNVVSYPAPSDAGAPAAMAFTYRSRWDGGRLVTTITPPDSIPAASRPPQLTQTLYLEDGELVMETTGPGAAGSGPVVQKAVYKRPGGM